MDARLWDSVTAVLMVVAAIDAAAMELYFDATDNILFGAAQDTIRRLQALRPMAAKQSSAHDKMEIALNSLPALQPAIRAFRASTAWADTDALIRLRNVFVHNSVGSITIGPDGDQLQDKAKKLKDDLRDKFATPRAFPLVQVVFPDTLLGPGLAEWAIKTGHDVINGFYACMGATSALALERQVRRLGGRQSTTTPGPD